MDYCLIKDIIFYSKVNIWNDNCARATAFIFDTRTDVIVKVSKFLRHKMSRPEGDSNPPTIGFIPKALTIWAIRARHLLLHVLNTGSGDIYIFEVELKFETENVSTWEGLEHPTFGFISNALTMWILPYILTFSFTLVFISIWSHHSAGEDV